MPKIYLPLAFFLFAFSTLPDFPKRIIFNHLNVSNGLPSNTINNIFFDDYGFVWIATTEGLCKFNGVDLQVFTPEKGNPFSISHVNALSMAEGENGNLFIGTENWLNYYNYKEDKFYPLTPKVEVVEKYGLDSRIDFLRKDSNGFIWLNQRGPGITFYNTNDSSFYNIGGKGSSNPKNFLISKNKFLKDKQGSYWVIGNKNNKLYRIDFKDIDLKNIDRTPVHEYPLEITENALSGKFVNIFQDSKNNIWFLGNHVMFIAHKNRETNNIESFNLNELDIPEKGEWDLIEEDDQQNIWLGSRSLKKIVILDKKQHVIKVLDENTFGLNPLKKEKLELLKKGKDNSMWLGSTETLMKYDLKTGNILKFRNDPSDSKSFFGSIYSRNSLAFDDSGTGWIITNGKGLDFFNEKKSKFNIISTLPGNPYNLPRSSVTSISKSIDGKLWLSLLDNGIQVIDKKNNVFKNFTTKHSKNINKVLAKNNKDIWVGHFGLERLSYSPEKQEISTIASYFPNDEDEAALPAWYVPSIIQSKTGEIWFGTSTSLSMFNAPDVLNERGTFKNYRLDKDNPGASRVAWNITEDEDGSLWVAASVGISRVDPLTNEIESFYHDPADSLSISSNNTKFVLQDKKGRIWIGTESAGLNLMQEDGKSFTRFTKEDGLPSNTILTMVLDNSGFIWMSTNRGISRLDPETLEFRNYDEADGLQGMQFRMGSYFKDEISGKIYFGGDNGVTVFDPEDIKDSQFNPQVYLTDFKIFDKEVKVGTGSDAIIQENIQSINKIELDHDQNTFSFGFTSIDYSAPKSILYAYKLEGFDQDWISEESSNRFAKYTNIDPGKYIFWVKATNSDKIWSKNMVRLEIIIYPPWWATWWFRTMAVLTVIGTAVSFYRYKTYKLKKQQEVLEKLVKERTIEVEKQVVEINAQNEELQQQAEELEIQRDNLHDANIAITLKNNMITDSINYAKRIQEAILPSSNELQVGLGDHFVIYRPKDIVSGDFYWMLKSKGYTFIAVVDCTGHGVPGACMSMMGCSLLNRIVGEMHVHDPAKILYALDLLVVESLRQREMDNKDGMDMTICRICRDKESTEVVYAGAKNGLFYYDANNEEIVKIKGNRFSIGGVFSQKLEFAAEQKQVDNNILSIRKNERTKSKKYFDKHVFNLTKDSVLYLTTDGLIDQNNPSRRRWGSQRFKEILSSCGKLPLHRQKLIIENALDSFSDGEKQRDDIALMGIKV